MVSKARWRIASKLPGAQTWDKMKLVDKGLSPLNTTPKADEATLPSNPFLRNAYLRAFAQKGVQPPAQKTGAISFKSLQPLWRSLRGKHYANRTVKNLSDKFKVPGSTNPHLDNLINESARGGTYTGMTHQIGPALGRMIGGSYIGHQLDSNEEGATPWGSIIGGIAGLGSPAAVRNILGRAKAPKGSLRHMFSDRTLSRRLVNDPLNRTMLSASMGNLVDMGAGALGYDTGGWGERMGIMGGLAGGSRPLAQMLGSRYKTVGNAMTYLGNTSVGKAFNTAQKGGFTHLPAYALGSPYVVGGTGTGAIIGGLGHGVLDATVGERVRGLSEKKKMITNAMGSQSMAPMKQAIEETLHQVYGPGVSFYDVDGTPSKEAIHLMKQLSSYGMMQLQNAGQNFFGDSGYIFNPNNWERLSKPTSALGAFMRGQARRLNQIHY